MVFYNQVTDISTIQLCAKTKSACNIPYLGSPSIISYHLKFHFPLKPDLNLIVKFILFLFLISTERALNLRKHSWKLGQAEVAFVMYVIKQNRLLIISPTSSLVSLKAVFEPRPPAIEKPSPFSSRFSVVVMVYKNYVYKS